jgi:hypothetical protein
VQAHTAGQTICASVWLLMSAPPHHQPPATWELADGVSSAHQPPQSWNRLSES